VNISLPEELEAWVHAKVESGMYTSASEVIREALRLQVQYDDARQDRIAAMDAEIDKGLRDLESDRVLTPAESRKQIEAQRRARKGA
jgi:antitoxin ParD1/3/4